MHSIVKGHHVYKEVWTPQVGKQLIVEREQFWAFCGSFSTVVAKSFTESQESGGTVTMYIFLFIAILAHNDFLRGYSATPRALNRDPVFNV